ncbi:hypothetical protein ACVWXU_001458 [Streptomyces sp. TE33382]
MWWRTSRAWAIAVMRLVLRRSSRRSRGRRPCGERGPPQSLPDRAGPHRELLHQRPRQRTRPDGCQGRVTPRPKWAGPAPPHQARPADGSPSPCVTLPARSCAVSSAGWPGTLVGPRCPRAEPRVGEPPRHVAHRPGRPWAARPRSYGLPDGARGWGQRCRNLWSCHQHRPGHRPARPLFTRPPCVRGRPGDRAVVRAPAGAFVNHGSRRVKIRTILGPDHHCLPRSKVFSLVKAMLFVHHQQTKSLLVSYSPKRLGFFQQNGRRQLIWVYPGRTPSTSARPFPQERSRNAPLFPVHPSRIPVLTSSSGPYTGQIAAWRSSAVS